MHECVELQFVFFFLFFYKTPFVAADKCVKMLQTHTPFNFAGACSSHFAEMHCGYWQEKKKPKLGTHLLVKKKKTPLCLKSTREILHALDPCRNFTRTRSTGQTVQTINTVFTKQERIFDKRCIFFVVEKKVLILSNLGWG